MVDTPRTEKVRQCAALIAKGRYKDAFDPSDFAIAERPNDHEAWRTKGDILWALKEYGLALVCHIIAEQASQREEYSEDMRSRFLDTSTEMTKDVVKRLKEDPGQFKDTDLSTDQGADKEVRRKRYIAFLSIILARLEKDPEDAKALYQEGLVLMLMHRYREALSALELLRKIEPRSEDALLKTIQILSELGEHERAYASAKAYLELRPSDPAGWELLGDACVRQRLHDEAIEAFERSLEHDPTNVTALFKKGVILGRTGRLTEAFRVYDQVAKFRALERSKRITKDEVLKEIFAGKVQITPKGEDVPKSVSLAPQGPPSASAVAKPGATAPEGAMPDAKAAQPDAIKTSGAGPGAKAPKPSAERLNAKKPSKGAHRQPGPRPAEEDGEAPGPLLPNLLSRFTPDDVHYVHSMIEQLLQKPGGGSYIYIQPVNMFEISLLILSELLGHYKMGGVVVNIEKPSRIFKKALGAAMRSTDQEPTIYVDLASRLGSGTEQAEDTLLVPNAFDLESLRETIDLGLHKVSGKFSGHRYFIVFDNIAALKYYATPSKVRSFARGFGRDLKKLHLYGYFLVAEGQMDLELGDMILNLPKNILRKINGRNDTS